MKPIEEILKETEIYEAMKAVVPRGPWTVGKVLTNKGVVKTKWHPVAGPLRPVVANYIAYAHNWSPETIIRELVEENNRLKNVLFYHGIKD